MKSRPAIDIHKVTICITVAASLGAVLSAILLNLAHPPRVRTRLSEIEQKIAVAEQLAAANAGPLDFPPGAVCHQPPDVQINTLKQRVQSAADAAGATLTKLEFAQGIEDEALAGLVPVSIHIEATGRYDAVVLMTSNLSKLQPNIFLDQADLKSQTTSVTISLNGRIFCSTSARL